MKLYVRFIGIATLAMATANTAAAQNSSPWLLNTIDVQRLVMADTPEAHTALAKHFIALAAVYKSDAARHTALANASTGNPNHPGVGVAARRLRQSEEAAVNANTARAVTVYHQILSIGGMAVPPAGATAFEGGKGAAPITLAQLNRLGKTARTRTDHRVLAEYYLDLARNEMANADQYATTAELARVSGGRNGVVAAAHGERMARRAREIARQANAAVERHRQLANIG